MFVRSWLHAMHEARCEATTCMVRKFTMYGKPNKNVIKARKPTKVRH